MSVSHLSNTEAYRPALNVAEVKALQIQTPIIKYDNVGLTPFQIKDNTGQVPLYITNTGEVKMPLTPAPGAGGQYAIFERSPFQNVTGFTNTAIDWDITIANNIPGLTLVGKQIRNTSGSTMVLFVSFSVRYPSPLLNTWINKQDILDDPNNPFTLQNNFYGQMLVNQLGVTDGALCSTATITLEINKCLNCVLYSSNFCTIGAYNPQVSIYKIA